MFDVACRFMLELKPEQCAEFTKKISQMAGNVGCKVTITHLPVLKEIKCFESFTRWIVSASRHESDVSAYPLSVSAKCTNGLNYSR